MFNCYVCGCNITKNNTYKEHIILNSLGGRLISPSIICNSCAPKFDPIDTALSSQLNLYGLMLNIERDRGKNPPIKVKVSGTDNDISLDAGGKPVLIIPIIQEKPDGSISITVRDERGLRKILNGLQRKLSFTEDIESIINRANKNEEYFDKPVDINVEIGGEEVFRAICKMIVSLYIQNGGSRQEILHLLPYILHGTNEAFVCYYYTDEEINTKSPISQILHRLFIKAVANEKVMYGYVELFSTFKFLILMSDNYTGKDFQHSYEFDVLNRNKVESSININLLRDIVIETVKNQKINLNNLHYEIQKLWLFIVEKQSKDCINGIIQNSINTAFEGVTEGKVVNDEDFHLLIETLSENIAKFLYSRNQGLEGYPDKNID